MAFTKITKLMTVIASLGTKPQDRPLTTEQFKAKFDEEAESIKGTFNTLIDDMLATTNGKGASQIGVEDSGNKFTATNVEGALAEIVNNVSSTASGKGASLVGIQDSGNRYSGTTVEVALAEIAGPGRTTETVKSLADLISTKVNPNAVRNGSFRVNRRAVSGTVTLAAGSYGHDGWKAGTSGCTYTFATSGGVTTLTITAGTLVQIIEGQDVESATYVMSWVGTAQGRMGLGSLSASGVTGLVTGGSNLSIEFSTGTLSKVKLEKGSVPTPFILTPFETENAMCQRYCLAIDNYLYVRMVDYQPDFIDFFIPIPATMRTSPSISGSGFSVNTLPGVTHTGFTFAIAVNHSNGLLVRATKSSHGLTDAMLATTGLTILSADL